MKVTFFQRKPFHNSVSIEHIFDMVRTHLPNTIDIKTYISTYYSKGLWRRMYNIFEAKRREGKVNHVTGDINYITYLLPRKRTILSIHGNFLATKNPFILRIYDVFWWYLPLRSVDFVTVVSETLRQEMIDKYNCRPEIIHVIPNPVNPNFRYCYKEFNKDKPIILQVGTKPAKNVERLFEALEGVHCHLHLIGTLFEKQLKLLKKYKIDYSNQTIVRPCEMQKIYENADIVTFVSTYEGFGMPIIEANRVGRVVVTGNRTAMPEVAANAAHLVNPFDVKAIRTGILKVLEDEKYRNRLVQNGIENAKRFDVQEITDKYLNLYKIVNGDFI